MTVVVLYDSDKDGKVWITDISVDDIDNPCSLNLSYDFAYLLPQDLALIS